MTSGIQQLQPVDEDAIIQEWLRTFSEGSVQERFHEILAYLKQLRQANLSLTSPHREQLAKCAILYSTTRRGYNALSISKRTMQKRMGILRNFYIFTQKQGYRFINPFDRRLQDPALAQLQMKQPELIDMRNAAILALSKVILSLTALAKLRTTDISLTTSHLYIEGRLQPLPDATAAPLIAYIRQRWGQSIPSNAPLWHRATCPGRAACMMQTDTLSVKTITNILLRGASTGNSEPPQFPGASHLSAQPQPAQEKTTIEQEAAKARKLFMSILAPLPQWSENGYSLCPVDLASFLHIPVETVIHWCERGDIPAPYALQIEGLGWRIHPDGALARLVRGVSHQEVHVA